MAAFSFVRDANGQPTVVVGTGANVAGTRSLAYDGANRLSGVCYAALVSGVCPVGVSKSVWAYDMVGNRVSETVDAGVVTSFSYDGADELVASVQGSVTTGFGYDGNGSVQVESSMLTDFSDVSPDVSYVYDAVGRVASIADSVGGDPPFKPTARQTINIPSRMRFVSIFNDRPMDWRSQYRWP